MMIGRWWQQVTDLDSGLLGIGAVLWCATGGMWLFGHVLLALSDAPPGAFSYHAPPGAISSHAPPGAIAEFKW